MSSVTLLCSPLTNLDLTLSSLKVTSLTSRVILSVDYDVTGIGSWCISHRYSTLSWEGGRPTRTGRTLRSAFTAYRTSDLCKVLIWSLWSLLGAFGHQLTLHNLWSGTEIYSTHYSYTLESVYWLGFSTFKLLLNWNYGLTYIQTILCAKIMGLSDAICRDHQAYWPLHEADNQITSLIFYIAYWWGLFKNFQVTRKTPWWN